MELEEMQDLTNELNGSELILTLHALCELYEDDELFAHRLQEAIAMAKQE